MKPRLAQAIFPIAWIAARVCYRDDLYGRGFVFVNHDEGKTVEAVVPKTIFIDRPALRSVENCFDRSIEFGEKCLARTDATLAIPT